ncbi:MAG TPA: radical SAM protein [Bryobacteraceae bacterium]|nr:radical SAM protein [Bryobacteraceae bacterium]
MDLLLTHGYFLTEDPKELEIMKPYPPLGILYLSSHLRSKGFDVEVYDSTFGSRAELLGIFEKAAPCVVGIAANLMTRRNALDLTAAARAAGCTVVVGGPEPANYAREYLDAGAQVVVEGEAEITMEELLPALEKNDLSALAQVRGISFRAPGGQIARTQPRELIANLDAQPWPDRERIDIGRYLRAWRERHGVGSVSVITARGCPYHCRWCSHSTYGTTHRRRSPGNVADEVEAVVARYQPDMLWMADDVFTIHRGWTLQYAAELKRRGLWIPFECITRADRLSAELADALAAMGCFRVWIGSESGSQRVLDAMQRGVRVEQVRNAVRLCRERGIQTGMFLMWGYEGEELEDIEATVEHVKTCLPDVFFTTVAYPIKGTPYYNEVAPRLVRDIVWPQSTDRDFKIRGRHSRRFYSHADTLLKSEVALHRLGAGDSAEALNLRSRIAAARQAMDATFQEVEA